MAIKSQLFLALLLVSLLSSTTITIGRVQAVFYKDICQTGPMYKVKIDPITGTIVPVLQEDPFSKAEKDAKENGGMANGVLYGNGNPFANGYGDGDNENNGNVNDEDESNNNNSNNNNNNTNGLPSPNISRDSGKSTVASLDDDPVGAIMMNDDGNNQYGDGTRRVLRSNRIWRDYEGDDEMEAMVVDHGYYERTSTIQASSLEQDDPSSSIGRRLLESTQRWLSYGGLYNGGTPEELMDDLKEGEFYVKPCLCESSRWTFPDDVDTGLPPTVYNDTTDTLIQDRNNSNISSSSSSSSSSSTSNSNSNSPDDDFESSIIGTDGLYSPNLGQHSNGQYVLVPHNNPDADLYLCHVQAMYCGIPIDIDQEGVRAVCFAQNMRHIIARNAWPLILLWYFGLAVICCCTVHGRTAGDFVKDRLVQLVKRFVCCVCDVSYDFNDRMLDRMVDDDDEQRGRRRRGGTNNGNNNSGGNNNNNTNTNNSDGNNNNTNTNTRDGNNNNDDDTPSGNNHPWCYSNQRRQFERSLYAQVQWIWRHQEYLRDVALREQGLPPPQLKLKIKKFRMETTTSASRDGGFGIIAINNNNSNNNSDGNNNNNKNTTTTTDDDNDIDDAQQQQQQQALESDTTTKSIDTMTDKTIDSPKTIDKKPKSRRKGSFSGALRRNSNGSTCSGGGGGGRRRSSNGGSSVPRRRNSDDSQGRRFSNGGRRNSNESQKKKRARRRSSNGGGGGGAAAAAASNDTTTTTTTTTTSTDSKTTALLKVLGVDNNTKSISPSNRCTICPKDISSPSSSDSEELELKLKLELELEFVKIDLGPNTEDGEDAPNNNDNDNDNENDDTTKNNSKSNSNSNSDKQIVRPSVAETAPDDVDDDDDLDSLDVPTCTICFCPFEEGDLIGDLSCKHEFHVECLKGWVQCKNACPLCNVRLGKPERPVPEETTANTTNDTNNTNETEGSQRNSLRTMMRRLNTSRQRSNNDNDNTSTTNNSTRNTATPGSGAGEISRMSRIGILGSISHANDLVVAQEYRAARTRR